ncbi:glycosyltransferase family 2 protein [Candidatus Woesearchaeota archaeon]|nr:glycosyltransferase family 2 protein [Candidatus Woesearchaeota archaeon]
MMNLDFGTVLVYVMSYFGLFTAIFFLITLYENRGGLKNPVNGRFPVVTIAVPAFNEQSTLRRTIESLLALDYPRKKLDIIVINDGSTDSTLEVANLYRKQGVRVFSKMNGGKGTALNLALKKARGELFGALDADSWVEPGALKKIVGYFNDPKIMAVTPSMKIGDPQSLLQKIQSIEYLFGIFLRKIFAFLNSIHVTPGPFSIFRKSFFDRYGGYSTHNLTEDIEVALRIQSHGYIIENSADACVYTKGPKRFRPLLRQRLRWYKGFLDNLMDYRQLFGFRHGNLGIFILPGSLISVGLAVILLVYTFGKLIRDSFTTLRNWYYIGFDLKEMLKPNFDLFYFNLNAVVYLAVFLLILGLSMIYIAKSMSDEKSKIKWIYLSYIVFYMPLFGFWWLVSLIYKATGRKIKWGPKYI